MASTKRIPFEFVLDELHELGPQTKAMFGCTAVYVDGKIVFVLRERDAHPEDNGIWLATTREHHPSLRGTFPGMRSIGVLGKGAGGETGWQMIPVDAPGFEDSAVRACELVKRRDPRIGKVPDAKAKKKARVRG